MSLDHLSTTTACAYSAVSSILRGVFALVRGAALRIVAWAAALLAAPFTGTPHRGARYPRDWAQGSEWLVAESRWAEERKVSRRPDPEGRSLLLGHTLPRLPVPASLSDELRGAYRATATSELHLSEKRRLCHILAVGAPGSGKTARVIIPALTREIAFGRGHVVAIDAKAPELLHMVGDLAAECGMRVVNLDPDDPHSDAIEPVWDCPTDELRGLIEAVIPVAHDAAAKDFFERKAAPFAVSLCTLVQRLPRRWVSLPVVAQIAHLPDDDKDRLWTSVVRFSNDSELPARVADAVCTLADVESDDLRDVARRSAAVVRSLELVDAMGPEVASTLRELRARGDRTAIRERVCAIVRTRAAELNMAHRVFAEVQRAPSDTGGSIETTVTANLEAYQAGPIARLFSCPDFPITRTASLEERTIAVIAVHTARDTHVARTAGALVDWALKSVEKRRPDDHDSPARSQPCWFVLDELPQLRVPRLQQRLNLIRGLRGGVIAAVQSVAQLRAALGDAETDALVEAFGTRLYMGGVGATEAESVARLLGDTYVDMPERGAGYKGRSVSRSVSVPLMTVRELQEQRVNGRVRPHMVLQAKHPAFLLEMPAHHEDPVLRDLLELAPVDDHPAATIIGSALRRTLALVRRNPSRRWLRQHRSWWREKRALTADRDPYALTIRAILGARPGDPRPALEAPVLDLAALGVAASTPALDPGRAGARRIMARTTVAGETAA